MGRGAGGKAWCTLHAYALLFDYIHVTCILLVCNVHLYLPFDLDFSHSTYLEMAGLDSLSSIDEGHIQCECFAKVIPYLVDVWTVSLVSTW